MKIPLRTDRWERGALYTISSVCLVPTSAKAAIGNAQQARTRTRLIPTNRFNRNPPLIDGNHLVRSNLMFAPFFHLIHLFNLTDKDTTSHQTPMIVNRKVQCENATEA
jgi:hypothetical protein